jgi:hypothetical protein
MVFFRVSNVSRRIVWFSVNPASGSLAGNVGSRDASMPGDLSPDRAGAPKSDRANRSFQPAGGAKFPLSALD